MADYGFSDNKNMLMIIELTCYYQYLASQLSCLGNVDKMWIKFIARYCLKANKTNR